MSLRHSLLLAAGGLLAGSLLAGCAAAGAGTSGPAADPTLHVAVVPAVDSAGFFVALYRGLFRAQGLNVVFTPAQSSETVIDAQARGQLDITGGNYVSYIQAQQNWDAGRRPDRAGHVLAADLDVFAEGSVMQTGAQALYTMPGSPIRTLGQLRGKTVAVNAPNNILYLMAAAVLAEHAVSPHQVHFVTVPLPDMAKDLQSGVVDAAVLPEPFASVAEQTDGAVVLADLNQGTTAGFPVQGYAVTKQWAAAHPAVLAAFYRALEQGQEIADTNRTAVEDAMEDLPMTPQPLGVSAQTAAVMALDAYPVGGPEPGSLDRVRLQRVVDVMQEFGGFTRSFRLESMLGSG